MDTLKRGLQTALRLIANNKSLSGFGFITAVVAVAIGLLIGLSPFIMLALAAVVIAGSAVIVRRRDKRSIMTQRPSRSVIAVGAAYVTMVLLVFGAIQLVPYGREHANPPVAGEPDWDSPRTRELMENACYDCHSNQAEWPWYSNVAPMSWAITSHVDSGRDEVNYSEFTLDPGDADETIEVIEDGSMPPRYYTAFGLHADANLSDSERAELIAGLMATPGMFDD